MKTLLYQVPGGMLSNLVSQLKEQNAMDKFYEVLEEIPLVREDPGRTAAGDAFLADCGNAGGAQRSDW